MDESEKIRSDRERLLLAIEVSGPRALRDHSTIVHRMRWRDPEGLRQAREVARAIPVGRSREWWREQARADNTDLSSLLRQRIKVLGWVRAGCPPIAEHVKRRGSA